MAARISCILDPSASSFSEMALHDAAPPAGSSCCAWRMALSSSQTTDLELSATESMIGVPVKCLRRTKGKNSDLAKASVYIGEKHRVGDAAMEKVGLTDEQIDAAEKQWTRQPEYTNRVAAGKKPPATPGKTWRGKRERPLLLLHVIQMTEKPTKKGERGAAKAFHPSLISSASTHNLEGGETGYFEVDLKSGLIINGEITQSISGTKAKYKENNKDGLENEFPQDAMIMKVDTNINAKSRICGSSDGFGDCTSIWTE